MIIAAVLLILLLPIVFLFKPINVKSVSPELMQKEIVSRAFICSICYESRFVSLKQPCNHEICDVCVRKIFATTGSSKKCPACRENLPQSLSEYDVAYHNISDLKSDECNEALLIAATEGDAELTKRLVSKLKHQNLEWSHLPVFFAAMNGHTEIVRLLAKENASMNRATSNGCTPVWIAAANGHDEIVRILAKEKIDLNRAMNDGSTPVLIAAKHGHREIVEFLAEERVDLNRSNCVGATPLILAVIMGHTEIVKFLIASNVTVEKFSPQLTAKREIKEIIVRALQKN